ncbi:hypothetical protein [Thermoanaerobacter italicus]|nr:hypothetical protein [Thermoanaerobacter italicus]
MKEHSEKGEGVLHFAPSHFYVIPWRKAVKNIAIPRRKQIRPSNKMMAK